MRMATSPSPARAESLNYNSSTDLTAENWKFTIAKAVSACTAPTPITALTYTGDAQTLINAGGSLAIAKSKVFAVAVLSLQT